MAYEKHISVKSGLPPGVSIYIGKHEANETKISALLYDKTQVYSIENLIPERFKEIEKNEGISWISISGLRNIEWINTIFSQISLHPLISEDVFNTKSRVKTEDYGNSIFIAMEMIISGDNEWHSQKVNFIVKDNLLISISESGDPFHIIQTRIQHPNGRFRQFGIDYLMYALIDMVVDSFFYALEHIEDTGEEIEERVLHNPDPLVVRDIQSFRHDLVTFRRQVWSLRECIMHLERSDSYLLNDQTRVFIRDVYDHVIKMTEDLDIHREMADGIMEIYLSAISNRTNDIVRTLTIIAVIFIPLTFITGVYGMNFSFLPGIHDPNGYIVVFSLMIGIAIIMAGIFRLKKWW